MKSAILLGILAVALADSTSTRIAGSTLTSIHEYPYSAGLLRSNNLVTYIHNCGGAIINTRSILTAAHCFFATLSVQWRIRVGSSWANDGGVVHNAAEIINHHGYNGVTLENDISILRSASTIVFIDIVVGSVGIASSAYILPDNSAVTSVGWGQASNTAASDQLRHSLAQTVNQYVCRSIYFENLFIVTDEMLCSGTVFGQDQDTCHQDVGSPILHNNGVQDVVIGVTSHTYDCRNANFPRVNTRISSYTSWIQANA